MNTEELRTLAEKARLDHAEDWPDAHGHEAAPDCQSFIAAVSPDTVIQLLDVVDAAQRLAQEGWTNPEYPHPGVLEDALIDALHRLAVPSDAPEKETT